MKFGGLAGVLINFRYGQSMAEAHVYWKHLVRVSFSILTPYVYLLAFPSATSGSCMTGIPWLDSSWSTIFTRGCDRDRFFRSWTKVETNRTDRSNWFTWTDTFSRLTSCTTPRKTGMWPNRPVKVSQKVETNRLNTFLTLVAIPNFYRSAQHQETPSGSFFIPVWVQYQRYTPRM